MNYPTFEQTGSAAVPSKERPIVPTESVLRARDAYLRENGFTVEAYDEPWTHASFFALDFVVPNTKKHRWAIMLHDLHHVATGYGTDLAGEGEISAWELRGGLRGLGLYVGSIVVAGATMGLLLAPKRTLRAFLAGKTARSLWTQDVEYEALLNLDVHQLRERTGVPLRGVSELPRKLHKNAPLPSAARASYVPI